MNVRTRPRTAASVMLVLAGLVGGGGLLTFMLFLFAGPFNLVNLGLITERTESRWRELGMMVGSQVQSKSRLPLAG